MQGASLRKPETIIKVDDTALPTPISPATPHPIPPATPHPISSAVPTPAAVDNLQHQPAGRLRRVGSISIKDVAPKDTPAANTPTDVVEAPPLDLERLQTIWNEMVEDFGHSDKKEFQKLATQLNNRPLEIEGEDQFVIIVSNSFLESEIKSFLIQMLSSLRQKSQRPKLNCRIKVVYEEKKSVAYSPRDKYDVMQQANSALDTFRILFPEVDY